MTEKATKEDIKREIQLQSERTFGDNASWEAHEKFRTTGELPHWIDRDNLELPWIKGKMNEKIRMRKSFLSPFSWGLALFFSFVFCWGFLYHMILGGWSSLFIGIGFFILLWSAFTALYYPLENFEYVSTTKTLGDFQKDELLRESRRIISGDDRSEPSEEAMGQLSHAFKLGKDRYPEAMKKHYKVD